MGKRCCDGEAHGEHRRCGCRLRAGYRAARQRAAARRVRRRTCCRVSCRKRLQDDLERAGPLEAIQLYDQLLAKYPSYAHNDQVLYQKARAYDELGRTAEAMKVMEQLIAEHPHSRYLDEVQFRRAEYFFTRKKYRDAESAYEAIIAMGPVSEYYELALYKLGWTLYKQEFYEEALHRYFALLDYKVSIGYDFDAKHEEGDERRIEDTFEVVSLSFSNLGGPEAVQRVLRRQRQAQLRRSRLPQPRRVLPDEAPLPRRRQVLQHVRRAVPAAPPLAALQHARDRDLRNRSASRSWCSTRRRSSPALRAERGVLASLRRRQSPEVLSYLKSNLQGPRESLPRAVPGQGCGRGQARQLRRGFALVRAVPRFIPRRRRVAADQLSAGRSAAREPRLCRCGARVRAHGLRLPAARKAAAAGYAAIYAHREHLKVVTNRSKPTRRRDTVASSLKFADTFPQHEHAAAVLGAAADDLYDMKDFTPALAAGRSSSSAFPARRLPVRRSAWIVVAHSSFDLAEYPQAEQAYARCSRLTTAGRRVARGARREPRGLDLQAGRAGERASRTTARPPITSCASSRLRRRRRSAPARNTTPARR